MIVETYPLTWGQEAMWFGQQVAGNSSVFHIARPFQVAGNLDVEALRWALARIVDCHPALRTTFHEGSAGPIAVVSTDSAFDFQQFSGGTDGRQQWLAEKVREPFDLERGPLARLVLRTDPSGVVGVLAAHHLIADLWSLGLFLRDLRDAYESALSGHFDFAGEREMTFAEHARQERGRWDGDTSALDYWRGVNLRTPAPLDFGLTDENRSAPVGPGDIASFELPRSVLTGLRKQSRAVGTSLFSTLMAGYATALHRWSAADELVLGFVSSGRVSPYRALNTIGYFANTVPVPIGVDPGSEFAGLASELHRTLRAARTYQSYPFPLLVDRLSPDRGFGRMPLVQAMFSVQKAPTRDRLAVSAFALGRGDASFTLGDAGFVPLPLVPVDVQHGLSLQVTESAQGLDALIEFDSGSFDRDWVRDFGDGLCELLASVASDPGRPVGALPVSSGTDGRAVAENLPHQQWDGGVHRRILARLRDSGDQVVLRCDDEQVTGHQLAARVRGMASALRRAGVGAECRVGVQVERGPQLVAAILGVLAAGGCFVPLDRRAPAARLGRMAKQAGFTALISADPAPWLPAGVARVSPDAPESSDIPGQCAWSSPDSAAYVLFTSGSTGQPKGVVVAHGALSNLLEAMLREPGLTGSDVLVAVTAATFDIAVFELLGSVLAGAELVLATETQARDPEALSRLLGTSRATVLQATPATWHLLVRAGWKPAGRFRALIGGEALPKDLAQALRCRVDEVWNCYGPTETTVWSGILRVEEGPVRIGGPVAGTELMVVDAALQPVGAGVPGELLIAGAGLARGYLGRPDLTAQRFVPHPVRPGERAYRTGDLVRAGRDGRFEFLGRIDQQVKVRGHRIEPGEVEAAVRAHPDVAEAAVRVVGSGVHARLVAWVVPTGTCCDTAGVREAVRRTLPPYLRPESYVELSRLPLTTSGKVDRRALPEPVEETAGGVREDPPATPAEIALADAWRAVLGVPSVGRGDDFFSVGGNSMLTLRVRDRLAESGYHVAVEDMLRATSLAELAEHLVEVGREPAVRQVEAFASLDDDQRRELLGAYPDAEDAFPVTAMQAAMLGHQQRSGAEEAPVYHNVDVVTVTAPFDESRLRTSLNQLVQRHPALRTSFAACGSEIVQVVRGQRFAPLRVVDGAQSRALAEEAARGFEWGDRGQIRFTCLREDDERFSLACAYNHAVLDGWSVAVVMRELFWNYTAHALPPAVDLLHEQAIEDRASRRGQREQEFWLDFLADCNRTPLATVLGTGVPTEHVDIAIGADVVGRLQQVARDCGAAVRTVFLAAYLHVLGYVTGSPDVVSGVVHNARPERPGADNAVGLFLNVIPLRVRLPRGDWRSLIADVDRADRATWPHRRTPLADIQRALGGDRVVDAMFSFTSFQPLAELERNEHLLGVSWRNVTARTEFPLACHVDLNPSDGGATLRVVAEGQSHHFAQRVEATLTAIADHPDSAAHVFTACALPELDVSPMPNPPTLLLHRLVERQATETPNETAISHHGDTRTYRELNEQANGIARHLLALGVAQERPVAVCLRRTPDLVAVLLAILKTGVPFVGIDPDYPAERQRFLLVDSQAPVLVTDAASVQGLEGIEVRRVLVDELREAGRRYSGVNLDNEYPTNRLAYLIYTSGSTGRPKAVAIEHRQVSRFVWWTRQHFPGHAWKGVLAGTSVCFDLSIFELFAPLVAGGKVVLAHNVLELPTLPDADEVRLVNTVPSAAAELVRLAALPESVRVVCLAGEALRPTVVRGLHELLPGVQVYNLYGPSEDTTFSTVALCSPEDTPIGVALGGSRAYVLDEWLRPVPPGTVGELYLGGGKVTRGYLDRPELTAQRFLPDPFTSDGGRMYRTGDRVRQRPDGNLEFLGRNDLQVKIRGFRVECGEIETRLLELPGVAEALVTVDSAGEQDRLVAYVAPQHCDAGKLRAAMSERLPDYLIPSVIMPLSALPRTPNGKVDRASLPPVIGRERAQPGHVGPRSVEESAITAAMAEVLNVDQVSVLDDFFHAGGDSLAALRLVSVLTKRGWELPIRSVFTERTAEALSARLRSIPSTVGEIPVLPRPIEDAEVSPAQARLWFLHQLHGGGALYHIAGAARLTGPLSVPLLRQALDFCVARHEAFRSSFVSRRGKPSLTIVDSSELPLEPVDLSALPESQRWPRFERFAAELAGIPFDLERAPLSRVRLYRFGPEDHALVVVAHHAVSDGVSLDVLLHDLSTRYEGLSRGEAEPAALPLQPVDFAAWQANLPAESSEPSAEYWRAQLRDVPMLDIAPDRPRTGTRTGARLPVRVPSELADATAKTAQHHDATPAMVVQAVFAATLREWTGTADIAFGIPVAGRSRPELDGLVGCFVNTLVLRIRSAECGSFSELLARTKETVLDAYAHQDIPFDRVVDAVGAARELDRNPLFEVMLAVQPRERERPTLAGRPIQRLPVETGVAKFDLLLELREQDDDWQGFLEYRSARLEPERAQRFRQLFLQVLARCVDTPQRPLDQADGEEPPGVEPTRPGTPADQPGDSSVVGGIWRELLGVEQIADDDDFFALGGHSLLATQVSARITEAVGVELPLRTFFEKRTLRELSAEVERQKEPAYTHEPSIVDTGRYPLSYAQRRIWLVEQLFPGTTTYVMPAAVRIRGPLDHGELRRTFDELIERHEALRTVIVGEDGEPTAVVRSADRDTLKITDARDHRGDQDWVHRSVAELLERPFDLPNGPLLRAELLQFDAEDHVLCVTVHHMVCDGWSVELILDEVRSLYAAGASPPAPPPARSYAEHAVRERERLAGAAAERDLDYWRRQLASPAALDLPRDGEPGTTSGPAGVATAIIPARVGAAIRTLAQHSAATPFAVLLAGCSLLLAKLSGSDDVCVGVPAVDRRQGFDRVIGNFLDVFPLRLSISGSDTPSTLVERASEVFLAAIDHRAVPFERVVEALAPPRSLGRHPYFDVFLNFQPGQRAAWSLPGLDCEPVPVPEPDAKFWLTFYVRDRGDGGYDVRAVYREAVFRADRMRYLLEQFVHLVDQVTADPHRPAASLSMVTPSSREIVADTRLLPEPRYPSVPEAMLACGERTPGAAAVRWQDRSWTYRDITDAAWALAGRLHDAGVRPGAVVAVSGPPSPGLVTAMLAVMLAHAVLLPVDEALPVSRIDGMLRESHARHLVHVAGQQPPEWAANLVSTPYQSTAEVPGDRHPTASFSPPDPDDPAYVIFTSGTTGNPKPVVAPHKSLGHFLAWQRTEFDIGPEDRCAQLTGMSFDVVFRDVFVALVSGATLVIPEQDERLTPRLLIDWLRRNRISVVHAVPSVARTWIGEAEQSPGSTDGLALRWLFLAGEPLDDRTVRRWRALFPGRIINLYGPSETVLAKLRHRIEEIPRPGIQPLGAPLPSTQALVLDGDRLCGIGEPGELAIRTPFRSLARPNHPEGFVADQWFADADSRDLVYRTGDRARWGPDGLVEYLGRLDDQVKVRGVRISPEEVARALRTIPGVRDAAVLGVRDGSDVSLSAYVVVEPGRARSAANLRSSLRAMLPVVMLPASIVFLDALPMTRNGKVDRAALRELPAEITSTGAEISLPVNDVQRRLAEVWKRLLGVAEVGVLDNFFDLGGHSLLLIEAHRQINDLFEQDISIVDLFRHPTIASLAEAISGQGGEPERRGVSAAHERGARRRNRTREGGARR